MKIDDISAAHAFLNKLKSKQPPNEPSVQFTKDAGLTHLNSKRRYEYYNLYGSYMI